MDRNFGSVKSCGSSFGIEAEKSDKFGKRDEEAQNSLATDDENKTHFFDKCRRHGLGVLHVVSIVLFEHWLLNLDLFLFVKGAGQQLVQCRIQVFFDGTSGHGSQRRGRIAIVLVVVARNVGGSNGCGMARQG